MGNVYLVIGSAGFVGSNFVRYIMYNERCNVIGIDTLQSTALMHNVYVNRSYDFFIGDVVDSNLIKKVFSLFKPSAVIYLASPKLSSTEICGLENILNCLTDQKLIYVSTTDVYKNKNDINVEDSKTQVNFNCVKSICAESLILSSGIKYNILRVPEVFGPRQFFGFIPNICRSLDKEVITIDNERNVRDLLYIEDLCNAINLCLKNENNGIYNVSGNNDFTDLEIISMIEKELKIINCCERQDKINVSVDKIKQIGWKPLRKFRDQIKFTFNWYENNKWALEQ